MIDIQPSISIRMKSASTRFRCYRVCQNLKEEKRQFIRYHRINPELKSYTQITKRRNMEILIHNLRLSCLDTCLYHHRDVHCHRCHEPFNASHYLVECPETEELSESVCDIVNVTASMSNDDVAERLLFILAEFDPATSESLNRKINHFYLMLQNNPINAGCPNGHNVIKKMSKYIK